MLSICWYCLFQALLLLLAANGAPVIAIHYLEKIWRGLISAVFLTTVLAILLGLQPLTGVIFATLTMAGDLLASFIKRRLGKIDSSRARGFDTVPGHYCHCWG